LPLLFLAVVVSTATASASVLTWLFPKRDVEVIAVTDMTPAGALRRPVTAANPGYYAAVSAGYRDFGGIVAGEKIPPKETVLKTIARVLAKQGYLPATDANLPSLLLVWTWGTMNADRLVLADPEMPDQQLNRNQLLRFMGAYKLGMITKEPAPFALDTTHLTWMRTADTDALNDLASEDLYVIAISAYDYAAALKQQKTLLWMTKISCPSRGLSMPETLPAMLALAGPHIGRDTEKPVMLKGSEQFKGEVKIGDPSVVEFLENTPVPVIEVAPAPKKADSSVKKQRKR
jgi:hypothetical protein